MSTARGFCASARGSSWCWLSSTACVWVIFGAFDRREASGSVRDFPLSTERSAIPPQPRLQIEPRQEMRALRQRDEAAAHDLRVGRSRGRIGQDSDRAGDAAHRRAWPAAFREPAPTRRPPHWRRQAVKAVCRRLCCVDGARRHPGAGADDRRARARLQARAGDAGVGHAGAAARDRLRPEPRSAAAARHARSSTRPGAPCGSATTSARGRSCWCSSYYECPMLCTQVLNGLASALGVLSLDAGQGVRDRHRQLRSARDAGARPPRRRPSTSSATSGRAPRPAGTS